MARIILILVLLLGAGGGAAWYFTRDKGPKPVEVITAEVRRQAVIEKVRAVGHVEPVTQVRVSSNVSGDLLKLPVKEGQTVTKGTLLAEIDRERLAALVRQGEASLRSAEAEVQLEKTQLAQAESERARTEGLAAKGLATAAELERARADVEMIRARMEAAKQRVEQARASLDQASDQVGKTRVVAPIDGTIIALNKKVGERIRGSDLSEDVLLTLAPLHAMQVEVDISEQDVVRVAVGQSAEITVDALSKTPSPGRVVEIASSAVITNRGTEAETTTFRVKVGLDAFPEGLRSGMSAAVSIVTKTHEGALAVPIEAVSSRLPSELDKRAGEKTKKEPPDEDGAEKKPDPIARREKPVEVVFVVADGKVEPAKVRTGISGDLDLEILDGLEAGKEIVIGPYKVLAKELMPGSPVKVLRKLSPTAEAPAAEVSKR